MKQVNLKKYQVTSVDDALAVIEDNGDSLGLDGSKERGNASLERGLSLTTRGGQALVLSQKGKKDTLNFTLQVLPPPVIPFQFLKSNFCIRFPRGEFLGLTDLQ